MKQKRNWVTNTCSVYNDYFEIEKDIKAKIYRYKLTMNAKKRPIVKTITISEVKVKYLNIYTLTIASILWRLLIVLVLLPLFIIFSPIYMYIVGLKNFITKSFYITYVRYFNWVNLILVIILASYLILDLMEGGL